MGTYPDGIYLYESREDVNKMKEELQKKEKTFTTMNKVGNLLTQIGSPVFVGSLVSPFDIEGPTIEIISAVVLVVGTLMKKISLDELEKLEAIKNNGVVGSSKLTSNFDQQDIENIRKTFDDIRTKSKRR
jgi:hypothetical protein